MSMEKKIREIVDCLNQAREVYYNTDTEMMSNKQYDEMYDTLLELEKVTGIIFPDSPTQTVGAEVVSKLIKVEHEYPALSLDKRKVSEESFSDDVLKWLGNYNALLSWKLDGLTVVATYDNGKLVKAATRGNGIIGEDITHNAKYFKGLPQTIAYKEHLVVRGEATISYAEFMRINSSITDESLRYKNPRNLASGTVRALDSNVCKEREVTFTLFEVASPYKNYDSKAMVFDEMKSLGFNVVEYAPVSKSNVLYKINEFSDEVNNQPAPVDGLVLTFDDINYSNSLGNTGHHSRAGLAIKWADETAQTTLIDIEWSASRTGLLNPVAIFDPVELEGTTVTRASLHNISYIKDKDLQIGDTITVYKANMIIPQIADNLSMNTHRAYLGGYNIPFKCPICGSKVHIIDNKGTESAMCKNPHCPAKKIYAFTHLVERDCLNIAGLSEETLSKFIDEGYLVQFADLYHLDRYEYQITHLEGFGKKSYDKIISAIEESRKCDFVSFIHACGIPHIGKGQAKLLKAHLDTVYDESLLPSDHDGSYDLIGMMVCLNETGYDWTNIEGFGDVIAKSLSDWIYEWFYEGNSEIKDLLAELSFIDKKPEVTASSLAGLTFVITGSVNHFKNRDELQEKIESLGGKCAGSVSAKTSYLINNDVTSTSGKNKKAKELGIPIISEEDFLQML